MSKIETKKILEALAVFGGLWILSQKLFGKIPVTLEIVGYGNPSMAGTFISLALLGTIYEPLAWLTALIIGRSTPLMVLCVYRSLKSFGIVRSITLTIALGSILAKIHALPSGTGRFEAWQSYCEWWWALPGRYHWLGVGFGKTAFWLPQVQLKANITKMGLASLTQTYLTVAHNDYIQALVELGYVGVGLLGGLAGLLFWRSPRGHRLVGAGLLVAMASNFPWHAWPHLAFCWWWVLKAVLI